MPKITAIKPQKRRSRFNVFIDGKFAFGVDEDTLVSEGLNVGKEIEELEIKEWEEKSEIGKLYQKALKFLEYRPRSEREIRNYIRKKLAIIEDAEDAELIIGRIVKKLRLLNYLNDLEFARWWVEQRRNSRRPKGIRAICSELYQKGVAKEIIEEVTKAENAEEELATKAAQKYLKRSKSSKQLAAYLARRGFQWEVIKTVVDNLLPRE